MKILHLTLKKKWFDMILSGNKKEEYRQIKLYWIKRFAKHCTCTFSAIPIPKGNFVSLDKVHEYFNFDIIEFKNGYAKNAPTITIEFNGFSLGKPNREWSDDSREKVFVLKLGEILSTSNTGGLAGN